MSVQANTNQRPEAYRKAPAGGLLWYAVQTKARHEKRIEAELNQKGIAAYVPAAREVHRWSDRSQPVDVPLFSCYAFVRTLLTPERRLEILRTNGVFRFVEAHGSPAAIPDAEIESVRRVALQGLPLSTCGSICIGEKVRIRGGSLDGVEGVLSAVRGENRLVISVELIQQAVSVTIDGYLVERVV
ncbi:MAG: UpxY family transcription antiterminator [Acidobacteriota bacterium]|nr:UpxY family transcription antiterminator [Acidobacteriota bacterium]